MIPHSMDIVPVIKIFSNDKDDDDTNDNNTTGTNTPL